MNSELLSVVLLFTALFGLWWLYFVEYRGYVVDETRQQLFAIRDELFQQAAEGVIPFEAKAYTMTRITLNGMIRFTHDISISKFLVFQALASKETGRRLSIGYRRSLKKAIKELPSDDAKKVIKDIQLKMNIQLLMHLVNRSIILRSLSYILFRFVKFGISLSKMSKSPGFRLLDAESYQIGADPHHYHTA